MVLIHYIATTIFASESMDELQIDSAGSGDRKEPDMTSTVDFVKTALLSLIALCLVILLVRIDVLVSDLRHSLDTAQDPPGVHQPQGQLLPKSDPSTPDLPNTVGSTIFV